jgi:hypothetical protein
LSMARSPTIIKLRTKNKTTPIGRYIHPKPIS